MNDYIKVFYYITDTMSSNPNDIRQQVIDNRGIIKKLELKIPGFRAYRTGDDLRISDALLRKQISQKLEAALSALQNLRSSFVSQGKFQDLTEIGHVISVLQQLDGALLHGQQGYSGISPAIRIDDAKLNQLYQYDLDLMSAAEQIEEKCNFNSGTAGGGASFFSSQFQEIALMVNNLNETWSHRIETIEKINTS